MPSPLDIAQQFAHALDADDFTTARRYLAPDCVYEVRGSTLHGPDAIVESYAEASRSARRTFDAVTYESEVHPRPGGARVSYTDVLSHGGREHRHRCAQELTVGPAGLITRVIHEDLPGEREAVTAFKIACGIEPATK